MKNLSFTTRFLFYFGYFFLYAPLFLIIIYAFNESNTLHWTHFSLKWFSMLLENPFLLKSAMISLKIACFSATFATFLGMLCASVWRSPLPSRRFLGFLAMTPLLIPEVIIGLSLLIFFVWIEKYIFMIERGEWSVIIAHTTLGLAYVTAIVRARLASLNPALREAALDLGARPYKIFLKITLPLIVPTLFSSWLIVFILSFDDIVLASFTSGPGTTTLPLMIFSSLKIGYTPQLNALATCIIVMASLLILLIAFMTNKKEK
jgi:putrescine transport system permease protein